MKPTSSQKRLLRETNSNPKSKTDETEIDLDLDTADLDIKRDSNEVELLSKCQEFIDKASADLNKIGIIMGSKFNDHSTRNSLAAIADQLNSIVNGINEKMVRISAKNEIDVTDLFPGMPK